MLDFECKHCLNLISTDVAYIGDVIECPSCGLPEVVPEIPYPPGTEYASYLITDMYDSNQLWTSYRVTRRDDSAQIPMLLKLPTQFFLKHVTKIDMFTDAVIKSGSLGLPEFPQIVDRSVLPEHIYFLFDYIPATHGLRFFRKIEFIDILKIIREIAVTLKVAWEKYMILHQGLTPGNIRITAEQRVRIDNVGVSHSLLADHALLDWGFNIWDLRYMSPELISHGISNTPACDIYSLGGILFYLITGHHPYDTVNPVDIIKLEIPNPLHYNRDIPPDILSLFFAMMNKDVEARLSSWSSVIKKIDAIISGSRVLGNQTQFVDRYAKSSTSKQPVQENSFARSKSRKKVFHKTTKNVEKPEKYTKRLILKTDKKHSNINKIHSNWKKKR